MERMFINQPSTLQPLHKYHGMNVLLNPKDGTVYPVEGPIHSMMVPSDCLSMGWTTSKLEKRIQELEKELDSYQMPELKYYR